MINIAQYYDKTQRDNMMRRPMPSARDFSSRSLMIITIIVTILHNHNPVTHPAVAGGCRSGCVCPIIIILYVFK